MLLSAFVLILLKVVEGFVFFLVFFFRAAIASGLVTVILRSNFLRAVAEACSPLLQYRLLVL